MTSSESQPAPAKCVVNASLFVPRVSSSSAARDASNGVTDPSGSIDEGEVRASRIIDTLRAALGEKRP